MRPNVMEWVEEVADQHRSIWNNSMVLEVGSRNINGSVRPIFTERPNYRAGFYLGIDKELGPGVDMVMDVAELPLAGFRAWGVVISTEMIEHVFDVQDAVARMWAQVRGGGMLILTTRGIGYGLHDEPEDYWRFTEHSMQKLVQELSDDWHVKDDKEDQGVYGYAIKSRK